MKKENAALQNEIETILLDTDESVSERIARLRVLFERENILLFSDFDDTIVDSSCVFFGRLTVLERLGKLDTPDEKEGNIIDRILLKYFRMNADFSKAVTEHQISGKIVVISRNYHALIRRFVLHADQYLKDAGHTNVSIIGGIGQIPGIFTFRSRDKLDFLPNNSQLIADSFEHETVRNADQVINVDRHGRHGTLWLYGKKAMRMGLYLLRIVILRKPY